jgi:uncharacterized protein YbaP (TraB family)
VNDFPTAVRVFEGMLLLVTPTSSRRRAQQYLPAARAVIVSTNPHVVRRDAAEQMLIDLVTTGIKAKVENRTQYEQYLQELEPIRQELGIDLKEVLYPDLPMAA